MIELRNSQQEKFEDCKYIYWCCEKDDPLTKCEFLCQEWIEENREIVVMRLDNVRNKAEWLSAIQRIFATEKMHMGILIRVYGWESTVPTQPQEEWII